MKLLLIQPPIEDFYDTDIRLQPTGLLYLQAAVQKHHPHIEVKIIDFHHGWRKRTLPLPKPLSYLKPYWAHPDTSPFSSFHHFYRFGATAAEIETVLRQEKADIIAVSCLFSAYFQQALEVAQITKMISHSTVIMGGSHVSALPHYVLQFPEVDFVIVGEGEKPLVEFLGCINNNSSDTNPNTKHVWNEVPNLGYKSEDKLFFTPKSDNYSINDITLPDSHSVPKYKFKGKPIANIITSRGCPYQCSFCSIHPTFGKVYRRRSVSHIISEIDDLYQAGFRVFNFEDDNLTYHKDDMEKLCQSLIHKYSPHNIRLLAMNGISYFNLDGEILGLMKKAGFTDLNISLVSSNEHSLKQLKRPSRIHQYLQTVEKGHELGFHITSYLIFGLPSETLDDMIKSLCYCAELPVLIGASLFYLTPGCGLSKCSSHSFDALSLLKARSTALNTQSQNISREDLYTLFVTSRIINFLKSLPIKKGTEEGINKLSYYDLPERKIIGLELLNDLLLGNKLYAFSDGKRHLLEKFNTHTFHTIWNNLSSIQTLSGGYIHSDAYFFGREEVD